MIRKLLATTAICGLVATHAFAQSTMTPAQPANSNAAAPSEGIANPAEKSTDVAAAAAVEGGYVTALGADDHLASDLTGMNVYASISPDAEKAGEIENYLISKDNRVVAAIVDTGSFLEKSKKVAVPFEKISWSKGSDDSLRPVISATRDELAAAPEFTDKPADEAAVQPPATTTSPYPVTVAAEQHLSKSLIGSKVYSGPGEDAQTIGSVNDLVIAADGSIPAALVGVGGFLGIGEKNVGVPIASLSMVKGSDNTDRVVLAATKEQLTAAPVFETKTDAKVAANDSTAPAAASGGAMTSASPDASGADATSTTASTSNTDSRAKLTQVTGAELTAENVVGATVYGPNDDKIGTVGDIALTADGKVDAVIVDVGGFLGIGTKQVAVAMDNLQFMRDSGKSMYLYTAFTQDQLKAAPEYNKDGYAQNRDTMRVKPGQALAPATAAQ